MSAYFLERKAELVGPGRVRKPPRDSRAVIEAYDQRIARERREREASTAARRLQRFLNLSSETP